jgi:hypothetical protein
MDAFGRFITSAFFMAVVFYGRHLRAAKKGP